VLKPPKTQILTSKAHKTAIPRSTSRDSIRNEEREVRGVIGIASSPGVGAVCIISSFGRENEIHNQGILFIHNMQCSSLLKSEKRVN
jgi:hypothetical protein